MICKNCQREIAANSRFCYLCGAKQTEGAAQAAYTATPLSQKRLTRSAADKKLGGVCAGFAEFLDTDATLIRVLTVLATFFSGGIGLIVYIVAWIVLPVSDEGATARPNYGSGNRLTRSGTDVKWAGVCAGIGEYLAVDATVVRLLWAIITVVTGIVPGIIAYVLAWMIMPAAPYVRPAQPQAESSGQPLAHTN